MKSFYSNRSKLVFLLPGFILFTLFVIYSIIPCFIMSLQNHNGAASLGWVGFDNYITTLKSPAFWEAHKNTYLIVALELIIGIPGSLLQALEMGQVLCDEAAYAIIRKLDLGAETEGKQAVVVFNPQPFEVEERQNISGSILQLLPRNQTVIRSITRGRV